MKKSVINLEKLEQAAGRLRAIAHPMRIAILDLLDANTRLSVTQIYEKLKIEQAAASHHLSILKNKNVVKAKRDGKKIFYSLKNDSLKEIIDCINRCGEK